MKQLKHELMLSRHTKVYYEESEDGNPQHFKVSTDLPDWDPIFGDVDVTTKLVGEVKFHSGPIKDGVNGVMNEDLLAMVLVRLEGFNQGEFRCRENSMAITKIEEALMWLGKRTTAREIRGVEGTHTV
jgi:hypothetical protein